MDNSVANIAKLLTNESQIVLTDGTKVIGAVPVATVMLEACKAYTKGYLIGRRQIVLKVVAGALLLHGASRLYVMVKNNPKWLD